MSLEEGLEQHLDRIKFLVCFEGADCLNKLVAYNQVLEALESDLLDPDKQLWSFKHHRTRRSIDSRQPKLQRIQLQRPHSLGRWDAYFQANEDHHCR